MKIKDDFVTNSSSCSFIVWGVTLDPETIKKRGGEKLFQVLFKQQEEAKHQRAQAQGAFMSVATVLRDDEIQSKYLEYQKNAEITSEDLEYVLPDVAVQKVYEEEEIMIGISPFNQKSDQTLQEFKQDICDKINVIGLNLNPEDLSSIQEIWENR